MWYGESLMYGLKSMSESSQKQDHTYNEQIYRRTTWLINTNTHMCVFEKYHVGMLVRLTYEYRVFFYSIPHVSSKLDTQENMQYFTLTVELSNRPTTHDHN